MPKRVFWPLTLVIFGLILMASRMGYLPRMFADFWYVLLIIVGLGGILISDREDWMPSKRTTKSAASTKVAAKPVVSKKAQSRTGKKAR